MGLVAYYGFSYENHDKLVENGNWFFAWLRLTRRLLVHNMQQERRRPPTERALLIWLRQAQVLKQSTGPLNLLCVPLYVFHLVTLDVTQMKYFLKDTN